MASELANVLKLLQELQDQHELSLLKLSEPLLNPAEEGTKRSNRSSSRADDENPSPTSLAGDLTHYRDLFTKLRFSYVEQVTKERFLRQLVSDAPTHIDPASNHDLETSLGELKCALQAQKASVNDLVAQLESQGRELAARHQSIEAQHAELLEMPEAIANLRADIERMRKEQGIVADTGKDGFEMSLSLEQTVDLVEEREDELSQLDRELEALAEERASRDAALERARQESKSAEKTRDQTVRSAREAQKRRKDGPAGMDEVEERGRWMRGVESTLSNLLQV